MRTLVETGMLVGAPGAYRLAQPHKSADAGHGAGGAGGAHRPAAAGRKAAPADRRRHRHRSPLPLLQAVAGRPEAELQRYLAHLQAAEFLYETRLFPEHEYTFSTLTYEVAYGSLLQERRRVLHARIVEALEVLAGDRVAEHVERLASLGASLPANRSEPRS